MSCRVRAPGSFGVSVSVTDSNQAVVSLSPASLVVAAVPSVVLLSDHTMADVGVTIHLTSAVSGGSGGLRFDWVGLPDGCIASGAPSDSCTPTLPGSIAVALTVTDQAGVQASSRVTVIPVYSAPSVNLSATPESLIIGDTVTVRALVVGGAPADSYLWGGLPDGCVGNNQPTIVCAPSVSGSFDVTLNMTDGAGAHVNAQTQIVVGAAADALPASGATRVFSSSFSLRWASFASRHWWVSPGRRRSI